MNLFASSPDPVVAASSLADRHVVKMVVETAQILSTALILRGHDGSGLYKPTHRAHPSVVWAASDDRALCWALDHGLALLNEYTVRYQKQHKSAAVYDVIAGLVAACEPPDAFVYVGPDEHGDSDPHLAYRRYLAAKYAAWGAMARWTRRARPDWMPALETSYA